MYKYLTITRKPERWHNDVRIYRQGPAHRGKKDSELRQKCFDTLPTSMPSNLGTVTSSLVTKKNGTGEGFLGYKLIISLVVSQSNPKRRESSWFSGCILGPRIYVVMREKAREAKTSPWTKGMSTGPEKENQPRKIIIQVCSTLGQTAHGMTWGRWFKQLLLEESWFSEFKGTESAGLDTRPRIGSLSFCWDSRPHGIGSI